MLYEKYVMFYCFHKYIGLERCTTDDSSSRRIMGLVPVFILETYNQTTNECLPNSSRRMMRCWIWDDYIQLGATRLVGYLLSLLGSLSMCVFETRTATGREHFTCQDSGVSQIFVLIISNGEKILSNVNVIVWKTGLKGKQLTSGCRSLLKNVRA